MQQAQCLAKSFTLALGYLNLVRAAMVCLGYSCFAVPLVICTWLPSDVMHVHACFLQAVVKVWCGTRAQQQSRACEATLEVDCNGHSQTTCPLSVL